MFRRKDRSVWRPVGGEIVDDPMLVEIDELTGGTDVDQLGGYPVLVIPVDASDEEIARLRASEPSPEERFRWEIDQLLDPNAIRLRDFIYQLSGKIAVTGEIAPEDAETLAFLLAESGPPMTPYVGIEFDPPPIPPVQ